MKYNRCGKSGLLLPQISLGLWHNFGSVDNFENGENIVKAAFDKGITHFDLANNYGPVPGSAETNFGKILKNNFQGNLRDQIVITTKAGYTMWNGPYGDWGSRKYLLSSLDQSLKRMNLEYVDVFYSHRFDPETPLEETMMALDYAVRSGKALYAGISNYNTEQTREAAEILKRLGTPCLIHQVKYSMFVRQPEAGLLDVLEEKGVGCIAFSPLAQGLLTDKYLKGIPENSRASNPNGHLQLEEVSEAKVEKIVALNEIAKRRSQSLAQMALVWLLKDNRITSVLIGASSVGQLNNNIDSLQNLNFSAAELLDIEKILG
ncbi:MULTISPECIES: aldo/keto reductase [Flavobacterium]|uniref:L-glyceraldehyde 3-phosphate reductase n=1 Tax=Flavobacterium ranwuense TaxID=2541725 RepID=A0ABY2DT10_9FLAO|nr:MULTISPECIES: aldo/keto reductase [Flavobacterium]TDE30301.1 L-glyceraldehyde 3-phosphate reductase [Flavobacterium ranwuense]TDE51018.1 L-glyceraldehyde 3-phosphate reductase [Flavobacterium sp. GT3P67]